ncbi:MAG TPA: heme-binding domain-containing protein [Verrucomicrobiae bacterium]|jgi:hypothetical protein
MTWMITGTMDHAVLVQILQGAADARGNLVLPVKNTLRTPAASRSLVKKPPSVYGCPMKKGFKATGIIGALAMIGLQFTSPSHQNPPVAAGHDLLASNAPPAAIAADLKNACYDCHSYETRWPWYSYIAPMSWSISRDVNAARASLNFSEWPHDNAKRERKRWEHIADEVQSGDMPVAFYARMHPDARLTAQQRDALTKWASAAGK